MSEQPETLQAAYRRLRETADSIVRLVSGDLLSYPQRELQRRFVQWEGADAISDLQLAEIQQQAKTLALSFVSQLQEALQHDAPWRALLRSDESLPEERKSLRAIAAVWSEVTAIDGELEALARHVGLPGDDRDPAGYQPPARFVGHQHLPTLCEHYFRHIVELRSLEARQNQSTEQRHRNQRAERWTKAGEP